MRLILCSIIFFSFCACSREAAPKEERVRPVKAFQIEDPLTKRSRPFPGVTRAEDRVNLAFRVGGPLIELPVDVGDRMKKGDLLARIDPRDFEIDLEAKKAELEKGKAALTFAQSDYARAKRIQEGDPGAISESLVDQKREEKNRLIAEEKRLEAGVDSAQDQLYYTYLRAPFDGIITAKYVDNFQSVKRKEQIVRLLNTGSVEMVVDIPETMISLVPHVISSVVTIDSIPGESFEAFIKEIGTEASATSRTYPVTLVMEQSEDFRILAGMSGEVVFLGDYEKINSDIRLTVPVGAVFTDEQTNQSYVWVINPESKQVEARAVLLGNLTPKNVEIEKGLNVGEWIVTAGVQSLREGQKVELLEP